MHAALAEDPWIYNGLLNGRPIRVLLDSGAAANFLSARVAAEIGLPLKDIEEDGVGYARMPDGDPSRLQGNKIPRLEDWCAPRAHCLQRHHS